MSLIIPLVVAGLLTVEEPTPKANDWTTTGADCSLFAAGDVDGDGFADVVTINGSKQLCVAYSVEGWKSGPWEVLAESVPDAPVAIAVVGGTGGLAVVIDVFFADKPVRYGNLANGRMSSISDVSAAPAATPPAELQPPFPITPPPYEPTAKLLRVLRADFSKDGVPDFAGVFDCTLPHPHRVLRVAIEKNPALKDQDADGIADQDEATIGSDPLDRDTDDDGLLDGFEVNGLPRGVDIGPNAALSPVRQDVICIVAPYEGIDVAAEEKDLERAKALFRAMPTANPDGSKGISLHIRMDPIVTKDAQHGGSWFDCGNAHLKPAERGLLHWMQVTPGGGGQAQETGDMGGCGAGFAVFAHEFGHQLSLSHTGDSPAAWCPLYPSLMNYAFSYSLGGDGNAVRFSDGRFRNTVLDESRLEERLPFPYADLKYLEAGPFRFTLADDGAGATKIDWNQNGRFDEGTVSADVNYGGSTHGGSRHNLGASGSGPALTVIGGKTILVYSSIERGRLLVRDYLGGEKWSDPRDLAGGATLDEPIVVGGEADGFVFVRKRTNWRVARLIAGETATASAFIDVPDCLDGELSAARVDQRVLLLRRGPGDALSAAWFDWPSAEGGKASLTKWQDLEVRSLVPPGVARDPKSGRLAVVTSWTNSQGARFNMRVSWFTAKSDALVLDETIWTHGEGAMNHCTTRPLVTFKDGEQLCVFHTSWPGDDGNMSMWRTLRVGNEALDHGWLTNLMYDVWTLTKVPIAFASGPQGAIYAFRWDAGDVNGMRNNEILVGHNGFGLDTEPMRDFDDSAKIALWGIRFSILTMSRTP